MNTVFLLLAKYNAPRLNVEQIADFMGLAPKVVRNRISSHDLPFATYKEGADHYADINDVAQYHDRMIAAAKMLRETEEA